MLATEDVTKKGLILPRRQIAASLFGMASRHSCIYPRTLSENTTKPSLKRASDRCCSTLALLSKHKFVRSACLRVKRIIHSACRLKIPSRTEKRTRTVLRDFRFCPYLCWIPRNIYFANKFKTIDNLSFMKQNRWFQDVSFENVEKHTTKFSRMTKSLMRRRLRVAIDIRIINTPIGNKIASSAIQLPAIARTQKTWRAGTWFIREFTNVFSSILAYRIVSMERTHNE